MTAADPQTEEQTEERWVCTRTIDAPPDAVFAVLCRPERHQEIEPTDWVREAIDPTTITAVGDVFVVNMYFERVGGAYVMHNLVTAFEPDRTIAWRPGQPGPDGELGFGGWFWRYDLEPDGAGTRVSLTYDWSGTTPWFRQHVGTPPPFERNYLDRSLAGLDRAVRNERPDR